MSDLPFNYWNHALLSIGMSSWSFKIDHVTSLLNTPLASHCTQNKIQTLNQRGVRGPPWFNLASPLSPLLTLLQPFSIPKTYQARSYSRAFALATPSARNAHPPGVHITASFSAFWLRWNTETGFPSLLIQRYTSSPSCTPSAFMVPHTITVGTHSVSVSWMNEWWTLQQAVKSEHA